MDMRPFGRLIPVSVAQQRSFRAVRPISRTERVPLAASLGRVASVAIGAPAPVPAFARATWDGYALRSRETHGASRDHPLPFRVVGEVYAEQAYSGPVGRNEAVAIATGGAIPAGSTPWSSSRRCGSTTGPSTSPEPWAGADTSHRPGRIFRRGTRSSGTARSSPPPISAGSRRSVGP